MTIESLQKEGGSCKIKLVVLIDIRKSLNLHDVQKGDRSHKLR